MKNLNKKFIYQNLLFILALAVIGMTSCGDTEDPILATSSFDYSFHNGQTVTSAPYTGLHTGNLSAKMDLKEMSNGNTMITITLNNTLDGINYNIHAHDSADAATTQNGTPYNETPNGEVFANSVTGNGGTVSISQEANMSMTELTTSYEGFLVVHDPLQVINTADITTYLIVGSFARNQGSATFMSSSFNYEFNTGQLNADYAYEGTHDTNLGATIHVTELADGKSRITVMINNTIDGMTYNTHAHDMADASTTPNGTPYNETPNAAIFANPIIGNGSTAGFSNISEISYSTITSSYNGFFVVHDPLQMIDTTNPKSYVVLGVFAR